MFFRPKPEPILSVQFQCVINAPTERRLRELLVCWDEGSATGALALRQALLRGQDLLLMPAGWWPNFQCPRRHGWWVRALSEVQVQLCSKCRNITAIPPIMLGEGAPPSEEFRETRIEDLSTRGHAATTALPATAGDLRAVGQHL